MKYYITATLLLICFASQAQYLKCKDVPTVHQNMEKLAHKPVIETDVSDFLPGCNVNDSIKKRVLYLLNAKWTEAELHEYLNTQVQGHYGIEKDAREMSKGVDSIYRKIKDSLTNYYMKEVLNYLVSQNYYSVDRGLYLIAARLEIKEAIPILRVALSDTTGSYDKYYLQLALARFGDKDWQQKLIDAASLPNPALREDQWIEDYEKRAARNLIFISTQESISKLGNWLDTSKRCYIGTGHVDDPIWNYRACCTIVMTHLDLLILNKDFQDKIGDIVEESHPSNELILWCKDWLAKNKGKYQINKDWLPAM